MAISKRDNVTIFFRPHTLRLAEETAKECFRKGADVLLNLYTDDYYKAYLTYLKEESLRQPSDFCRVLTEASTVEIGMGQWYDPSLLKGISPSKLAADNEGESKAHFPLQQKRKIRWISVHIGNVTKPRAKAYGYNYGRWRRMVDQASNVNPKILSKIGTRVASILGGAKKAVLTTPGGTKLEFSLKGRTALVHDGIIDWNDLRRGLTYTEIPSGLAAIAPVETSAEGKALFDYPIPWSGRMIRRLEWTFKRGRITGFRGDSAAMALRKSWEKASGDKGRIGVFTVGINPKAKLGFSLNQIAAGAISIAIGDNQDLRGRNRSSFFHQSTLGLATLIVDGRTLVKAGRLLL